eukprot:8199300-Pyramimonas_sp.AAC.2
MGAHVESTDAYKAVARTKRMPNSSLGCATSKAHLLLRNIEDYATAHKPLPRARNRRATRRDNAAASRWHRKERAA